MARRWDANGNLIEDQPRRWDEHGNPISSRPAGYDDMKGSEAALTHGFTGGLSDLAVGSAGGVADVIKGIMAPDRSVADVIRGAPNNRVRGLGDVPRVFGQGYTREVQRDRAFREQFQRDHPIAGIAYSLSGLTGIRGANVGAANAARRAAPAGEAIPAYVQALRSAPASATPLRDLYGTAVGISAVSGAAQNPEDPIGGAVRAGGTALVGAGALHGLAGTAGVVSRFGLNPEQRAARLLRRDIEDAGMTPDALESSAAARRRQVGGRTAVSVAEVGGEPMTDTARALSAANGPGKQIGADYLAHRTQGLDPERIAAIKADGGDVPQSVGTRSSRVASALSRRFQRQGSREPMDVYDARRSIDRAREAQADTGYRMAYAQEVTPEQNAQLQAMLGRLDPQELRAAATSAERLARLNMGAGSSQAELGAMRAPRLRAVREEIVTTERALSGKGGKRPSPKQREQMQERVEQLRDEEAFLRRSVDKFTNHNLDHAQLSEAQEALAKIANGEMPDRVSVATVDYLHRAFGQMADEAAAGSEFQRAYGSHKQVIDQVADAMFPDYARVRSMYRETKSRTDFLDHGQRILTMPEGELRMILRGQNGRPPSIHELDDLVAGALSAIQQKLDANDISAIRGILRNKTWQGVIERTIGKTESNRLMRVIRNEVRMQDFANKTQGGSPTARIKEDVAARTEGEDELSFMDDAVNAGFDPMKIAGAIGRRAYDRFRRGGIADKKVNEAVARYIYTPATEGNVKRLADDIRALPFYSRAPRHSLGRLNVPLTAAAIEEMKRRERK